MKELGVDKQVDKTNYVINVNGDLIILGDGKKVTFKIKGYDDSILCIKNSDFEIAAPNGLVDKKQMKVVNSIKSLYTYCDESGMATSSFLPKALYVLQKKEAISN